MPHHGSRGSAREGRSKHGRRTVGDDWSAGAWLWEAGSDPGAQHRRRARRMIRTQRLIQRRAEIAAARLRHPSMFETSPIDLGEAEVPAGVSHSLAG